MHFIEDDDSGNLGATLADTLSVGRILRHLDLTCEGLYAEQLDDRSSARMKDDSTRQIRMPLHVDDNSTMYS